MKSPMQDLWDDVIAQAGPCPAPRPREVDSDRRTQQARLVKPPGGGIRPFQALNGQRFCRSGGEAYSEP